MNTRKVYIPFTGFYGSSHSECMDDAVESMLEDQESTELSYATSDDVELDWTGFMQEYSEAYLDAFFDKLQEETGFLITTFKLDCVISPREYNFETDRILADVGFDELVELFAQTDLAELKLYIEEQCTSRSGFISFYSNELHEWLVQGLVNWDSVQLGLLLEFHTAGEFGVDVDVLAGTEIASGYIEWKEK